MIYGNCFSIKLGEKQTKYMKQWFLNTGPQSLTGSLRVGKKIVNPIITLAYSEKGGSKR